MSITRRPQQRRRMKQFRIEEMSVVDRPAQEGALATIVKRADDVDDGVAERIVKHYQEDEVTDESLAKFFLDNQIDVAKHSPVFQALDTSLRSIIDDTTLDNDQKAHMMRKSADAFLVEARLPEDRSGTMTLNELRKQMGELGNKLDAVVT